MIETIVIDTNIIVSALISNNQTVLRAIFDSNVLLVSPKFVIVELFKHSARIQKATKLSKDEILELFSNIINQIKFYDEDLISIGSWTEAYRLCREIDLKDTPYIALALELNVKLWTKDEVLKKGLKKKGFDKFLE
jgi:predicted nucleic acid-binding protein